MSINKDKLRLEVVEILEPFRDIVEGAEDDVRLFFERAAILITECIAIGDMETAQEIVGGLRALAWSVSVELSRANAEVFRRSILFAVRMAIAALAAV